MGSDFGVNEQFKSRIGKVFLLSDDTSYFSSYFKLFSRTCIDVMCKDWIQSEFYME